MTTPSAWRTPVLTREGERDDSFAAVKERHLGRFKSAETRRKYGNYIDAFNAWMHRSQGGMTPDQVMTETLEDHLVDYHHYLQQPHADGHPGTCFVECAGVPYGPAGYEPKITAVRSWFGYLDQTGRREGRPGASLRLPGKPTREGKIFLPEELRDIRQAARWEGIREEVLVGLFFGMGLRCDDAANVQADTYQNLGDNRRRLGGYRKGHSWAEVDVPYKLVDLFDEYLDGRTAGPFLLPLHTVKDPLSCPPLNPSTLFRSLQKVGRKAGYLEIATHDGKRTATTLASTFSSEKLPQGPSLDRLARFFNHKNPRTTMGYIHTGRLLAPGHQEHPFGVDWDTQAR